MTMSESNEQGPEMGDMGAVAGEYIEGPEITDESIQDFIDRGGEAPAFHSILEVWRAVLAPAAAEADTKITPQWANRITSSYRELNFADMPLFRDRYFGKILELTEILNDEIESDEECLNVGTPAEDAEENGQHYRNLLRDWQLAFLSWELAWDCTDADAAVELAAISEVYKMFFGSPSAPGITQYLDNISFEYTEADRDELAGALEALKEGR